MTNRVGNPGVKFTVKIGKKSKTFKTIQDAARHFKIPYNSLYQRLFIMGWSATKAVTTKIRKIKKKARKARSKK